MATKFDTGLFSTPEQTLAAEATARATDPHAAIRKAWGGAGRELAGAFSRGLGGEGLPESEAVRLARSGQEAMQGLDTADPQSYFAVAKRLNESGLTNEALKLGKIGNDLLKQQQDAAAKGRGRGDYWTHEKFVKDGVTVSVPYNHRTNEYDWSGQKSLVANKLLVDPSNPDNQAAIAAAKKRASIRATEETTAQLDLPKVESDATYLTGVIDKVLEHPSFGDVVGAPSLEKATQFIPGTPESDFRQLQKQVEGKTFMTAYETLKGGGQITELEGNKATESLHRMKTASSEEGYIEAATEFKAELQRMVQLKRVRAGMSVGQVKLDQRATAKATQIAEDGNGDRVFEIGGVWQYANGTKYGAE